MIISEKIKFNTNFLILFDNFDSLVKGLIAQDNGLIAPQTYHIAYVNKLGDIIFYVVSSSINNKVKIINITKIGSTYYNKLCGRSFLLSDIIDVFKYKMPSFLNYGYNYTFIYYVQL